MDSLLLNQGSPSTGLRGLPHLREIIQRYFTPVFVRTMLVTDSGRPQKVDDINRIEWSAWTGLRNLTLQVSSELRDKALGRPAVGRKGTERLFIFIKHILIIASFPRLKVIEI
jgi:hypothetical protein